MLYLWVKVAHILAVISWMAGVLYLYRILINIVDNQQKGQVVTEVLSGMAVRLYKVITMPAMGFAVIIGIAMLGMNPGLLKLGSMHVKLTCIVFLIVSTVYAGRMAKQVAKGDLTLPNSKTLRILNEVPTLLMVIIVIMVVVKPF